MKGLFVFVLRDRKPDPGTSFVFNLIWTDAALHLTQAEIKSEPANSATLCSPSG